MSENSQLKDFLIERGLINAAGEMINPFEPWPPYYVIEAAYEEWKLKNKGGSGTITSSEKAKNE